jgi:hypothetical protein
MALPAFTARLAIEWHGRSERHYSGGKLHREGGPAAVKKDAFEGWYQRGELHREGGPAAVIPGNLEGWFVNGRPHRETEAAIVQTMDHAHPSIAFERWAGFGYLKNGYAGAHSYKSFTTRAWCIDGRLHRADGPAFTFESRPEYKHDELGCPERIQAWHCDGSLHREGGPALTRTTYCMTDAFGPRASPYFCTSTVREWFVRGLRDREDGDAIEAPFWGVGTPYLDCPGRTNLDCCEPCFAAKQAVSGLECEISDRRENGEDVVVEQRAEFPLCAPCGRRRLYHESTPTARPTYR